MKKRERELTALKGALKEEVSSHDQEMDKLKEQYDAELQALRESVEEATKVGLPAHPTAEAVGTAEAMGIKG